MIKKNFLTLGTLSLLLSSTLLGGEVEPCPDCFATSFSSPASKVETTSTTTQEVSIASVAKPVDNDKELMITFSEVDEDENALPLARLYCDQNKIPVYENDSEFFSCI